MRANAAAAVTCPETSAGWVKHASNPVLGGDLGTVFDVSVLYDGNGYRMWFSWRPKKNIALVESKDGVHWNRPTVVLGPNPGSGWEDDLNRPVVLFHEGSFRMWYTGQARKHSWIGYATSPDGITWGQASTQPVLAPELRWEKRSLMCPHVLWDDTLHAFRMWYSGGGQYEPVAIGYATSPDGLHWTRLKKPVFTPAKDAPWERERVAACQVIKSRDWFLMFYIGFSDIDHARIGVARSKDGIFGWERHPSNPILAPGKGTWDGDACYKPYAIFDGSRWLLWYNGRRGSVEQIGLATHEREDLGF
nr:family 43 glycosylhydrolase [Candidatus Sigynarchaeota archaeon]